MQVSKGIDIGNPCPEEYGRVGELVYLVDPYIYPALFGSAETAKIAMPMLMGLENSPFAPDKVYVAREDGDAVGLLVLYKQPFDQLPNFTAFLESALPLPGSSRDVSERYLAPMCQGVRRNEAYISCIATSPEKRGRGIASMLITRAFEVARGLPVVLDVLRDNKNAIRLYEKHGFSCCGRVEGYAFEGNPPEVVRMKGNIS